MYPALGNIDENLASLSRSLSMNCGESPSSFTRTRPASGSTSQASHYSTLGQAESPAFQFLSRFGSLSSTDSGTTGPGITGFGDPDFGDTVGGYRLGKTIGYGGFSQIKEAIIDLGDDRPPIVRAVKIVSKWNPKSSAELLERVQTEFSHEVEIWRELDHPHIIKLLSVENNDRAIYCFTDKITGGTLFDLVRSARPPPPLHTSTSSTIVPSSPFRDTNAALNAIAAGSSSNSDSPTTPTCASNGPAPHHLPIDKELRTKYAYQLASALHYLHRVKQIVHRDVKLENCLLEDMPNGEKKVLLCDFGLSEYYNLRNHQSMHVIGPADTSSMFNQHRLGDSHFHHNNHNNHNNNNNNNNNGSASPDLHLRHAHTHSGYPQSHSPHHANGTSTTPASADNSPLQSPSFTPSCTQNFGSMPYASPQLLLSEVPIVDPSVDMWSFGVVCYALFMNKLPWHHSFLPRLRAQILEASYDADAVARAAGPEMAAVISMCLQKDVQNRATIAQVIASDAFKEYRDQELNPS